MIWSGARERAELKNSLRPFGRKHKRCMYVFIHRLLGNKSDNNNKSDNKSGNKSIVTQRLGGAEAGKHLSGK